MPLHFTCSKLEVRIFVDLNIKIPSAALKHDLYFMKPQS